MANAICCSVFKTEKSWKKPFVWKFVHSNEIRLTLKLHLRRVRIAGVEEVNVIKTSGNRKNKCYQNNQKHFFLISCFWWLICKTYLIFKIGRKVERAQRSARSRVHAPFIRCALGYNEPPWSCRSVKTCTCSKNAPLIDNKGLNCCRFPRSQTVSMTFMKRGYSGIFSSPTLWKADKYYWLWEPWN